MAIEITNKDDQQKLDTLLKSGVQILREIETLKEDLKEQVKAIGEELSIKPKVLNQAIKADFKSNINALQSAVDEVRDVLVITKRI